MATPEFSIDRFAVSSDLISSADPSERTNFGNLFPVHLPTDLSEDRLAVYLAIFRVEEVTRLLRHGPGGGESTGELLPPSQRSSTVRGSCTRQRARSPSPPPSYDAQGRRTNTREQRYKKQLEDERHELIQFITQAMPEFRPPSDYNRRNYGGQKMQTKVYIPYKEHPHIAFFGVIAGPRGMSLKRLEEDVGIKVSIRGKGSMKDGRPEENNLPGMDDEMHCLITADSPEKLERGRKRIQTIIADAISTPDNENEAKRLQLRELAMLNGTLRDDDSLVKVCANCGKEGHVKYKCPEPPNPAMHQQQQQHQRHGVRSIICRACGGQGHIERDCLTKNDPERARQLQERERQHNAEYDQFLVEIGE
ncbi:eukaryotic type KH-domain (KH-domain type I), partial [Ramicandelaber brevisporus]